MSGMREPGSFQPPLDELLKRYLQRQAASALPEREPEEVVPYEAAVAQPVDPRLAWNGGLEALRLLVPGVVLDFPVPADWPLLVATPDPMAAVPLATGNFPQLIRRLHPLVHAARLSDLQPAPAAPLPAPDLAAWARRLADRFPAALLALGVARLARHFDRADEIVGHHATVPRKWHAAWANEESALAWQRGHAEDAYASWQAQSDSPPVLFNRGMAALFLDRPAEARAALEQAVAQLPEAGSWHHLGRLYLALAAS
jgi:hypothetical protein